MDRLGKDVLPGPCLPAEHDRQVTGSHHGNVVLGLAHFLIDRDNVLCVEGRGGTGGQLLRPVPVEAVPAQLDPAFRKLVLLFLRFLHRQIDGAHDPVPIFDGEGDRGNQDPILSAFFQILFLLIDRPSKLHRAVQRTALWRQIWVYIQELLSDQLLRFIQIGQLFIEFRGKQDLSIQIQDRDAINITLLKN